MVDYNYNISPYTLSLLVLFIQSLGVFMKKRYMFKLFIISHVID